MEEDIKSNPATLTTSEIFCLGRCGIPCSKSLGTLRSRAGNIRSGLTLTSSQFHIEFSNFVERIIYGQGERCTFF